MNNNMYVNLVDASKITGTPVMRLQSLIRNDQINGVLIPGSSDLGFVDKDTVDDLLRQIR